MNRVPCLPRLFAGALAATLILAGCSGGAATLPVSSPAASSAAPSNGPAKVTTKEEAVDAVIAREPRFLKITEKDPDMIGQSSWYEATPASGVGAFIVTMRVGWGDCPSGCIDEHVWTYAVAPDGAVTLQKETGTDPPANAWPANGGGGGEGS